MRLLLSNWTGIHPRLTWGSLLRLCIPLLRLIDSLENLSFLFQVPKIGNSIFSSHNYYSKIKASFLLRLSNDSNNHFLSSIEVYMSITCILCISMNITVTIIEQITLNSIINTINIHNYSIMTMLCYILTALNVLYWFVLYQSVGSLFIQILRWSFIFWFRRFLFS